MMTSYYIHCLPNSVLPVSGYGFDEFIRNVLGDAEADLLKKCLFEQHLRF